MDAFGTVWILSERTQAGPVIDGSRRVAHKARTYGFGLIGLVSTGSTCSASRRLRRI